MLNVDSQNVGCGPKPAPDRTILKFSLVTNTEFWKTLPGVIVKGGQKKLQFLNIEQKKIRALLL